MLKDDILLLIILFFIYSLMGWIWECIYESILNKKLLNRGFLVGPYIPIYGFAGLIYFLLLSDYRLDLIFSIDGLKQFLVGSIVATMIEYVTSYILERFLNARWWDYSNYPLNLNGRVCLIASVFWGIVTVIIINIINPFLLVGIGNLNRDIKLIYASSMITMFTIDFFVTVNSILDLNSRLRLIISLESIKNIGNYKDKLYKLANPFTERIIESFPEMKFNSEKMQSALSKLKGFKHKNRHYKE